MAIVTRNADVLNVRAALRFDFAACEALQAAFEPELAAGYRSLVIDLSAAEYIDSAGLGMLLYMDHVSGPGVDVRVVGARGQVLDAVRRIHIDQVVNIVGPGRE